MKALQLPCPICGATLCKEKGFFVPGDFKGENEVVLGTRDTGQKLGYYDRRSSIADKFERMATYRKETDYTQATSDAKNLRTLAMFP